MLAWGGKTSNFTEEAPEGQRTDLGLDTTSCEVLSFITQVLGDRDECSIALYLFLLGCGCINSRRTLFRALLKKSVKQVLIPKFIVIGDVLDDSSLHQSVSIYNSFTTVRGEANFNQPVHQVTATEGPSRSLCATPVCQRNDSPIWSVNLVSALHDRRQARKNRRRQGKTA